MYSTSTTTSLYDVETAGALAMGTGVMVVYSIIMLAVAAVSIISMWKIFTKAGKPGWAAIVPVYNMVVLYQIVGMNPLWLLLLIGSIIPFVNFIVAIAYFVITILVNIKLAKAFGKSGGFAVGLIFLPFIFQCILGFGSAQYQGIQE